MSPETVAPGGMAGPPGWFLRVVRDQRVAFLIVGAINTAVGFLVFAGFLVLLGKQRYLVALVCSHVVAVLIAFVLYRFVVTSWQICGGSRPSIFRRWRSTW